MLEQFRVQSYGNWEGKKLGGQRSNEFETETEAVTRSNNGRQTRRSWRIELDFQQIARIQQDSSIETMPPSLSSVPRPSTTVVENPLEVTTRTGKIYRQAIPTACVSRMRTSLSIIIYAARRGKLPR